VGLSKGTAKGAFVGNKLVDMASTFLLELMTFRPDLGAASADWTRLRAARDAGTIDQSRSGRAILIVALQGRRDNAREI
jgi:hypothetical protein